VTAFTRRDIKVHRGPSPAPPSRSSAADAIRAPFSKTSISGAPRRNVVFNPLAALWHRHPPLSVYCFVITESASGGTVSTVVGCRYGSPRDGSRSIAFLAKGLACSSRQEEGAGSTRRPSTCFRQSVFAQPRPGPDAAVWLADTSFRAARKKLGAVERNRLCRIVDIRDVTTEGRFLSETRLRCAVRPPYLSTQ
jgi:hypothetical protein